VRQGLFTKSSIRRERRPDLILAHPYRASRKNIDQLGGWQSPKYFRSPICKYLRLLPQACATCQLLSPWQTIKIQSPLNVFHRPKVTANCDLMENIPLERAFIRNSGENNLSQVQRFFGQPALESGATLQDNLNYGGVCSLYWSVISYFTLLLSSLTKHRILFRAHWVLVIFDYALRIFYYGVRLMNFYDLYFKLYHFSPQPGEMGQALVSQNTWAYISTVLASSSHAQWRLTLIRLRLVWKLVLTMSILLIP